MNKRTCMIVMDSGRSCGSPPLRDGEYCRMHNPENAQEVAEARRLGGLRRRREVAVSGAYEFNGLSNVSDIRRLIEIAVLDTLGLENSVARNRTLAYLAQVALKSLEAGEFEYRLSVLESAVQGQNDRTSLFEVDIEPIQFPTEEQA